MDENKLLHKIGNLIDKKLAPIKEQLDTVELKVELVNKRVEEVHKKIEQSQEDTIEALSELIHTGYNMHESRIKKLEKLSTSTS
jgi:hypothetical protein